MKKTIATISVFIISLVGVAIMSAALLPAASVFADQLPGGTMTQSGTLTGGHTDNGGGGATWLSINGTRYNQTGAVGGGGYTWSGLSIPFNSGDSVSVVCVNGCSGSVYITADFPPPPAPPVIGGGAFITVPTGTAAQYTATVGSQFSDVGTLEIIALGVGIPLFFYIVGQLIAVLPGKKRNGKTKN